MGEASDVPTMKKEVVEKVPMYKLFAFADAMDIKLMIAGTVGAVLTGLSMPLMALLMGALMNAFSATKDNIVHEVGEVTLKFVYLAIMSGLASFLQVSCWMIAGERQAARMRSLYLETILKQDIAFFDNDTSTGEVIGRLSGDTILIQEAIGEKVGKFIQLTSTFFLGFLVAFVKGPRLAVVMLATIPPVVIAGAVTSLLISKMSARGQKAYSKAGHIVEQTVGSIRTVVSFGGEKQAIKSYNDSIQKAFKSTVSEGTASGLGFGTVMMVTFSSYGLAIWYGSKLILENGYDGGMVISVMVAAMTSGMSLGQASPCMSAFAAGQAAAYKMFETIKRKPIIDTSDTDGIVLENIKGDIELKDVYFSYPARPDQKIFDGFSLFVPSGTKMALVGGSGSGKSTVISLVERFYDPTSGEVLIDGVNLKKLNLNWIRSKVGLVSQEPILFTTTIKENIAYGKEDATDEEIRRSIVLANAAKFIDKMPDGLDTMVGEHGTALSGGQKQRIAIARAILKSPKILLLDEATSALDAESERIVQDALENIMVGRTTIVVAHRLSTIKTADTITVVQRGKLVEQGSHSELLKIPDGAYSHLVRLQEVNRGRVEDTQVEVVVPTSTFNRSISKGSSVGGSSRRSSLGASSRCSFSASHGIPIPVAYEERDPMRGSDENHDDIKRKPVSISRLAALNKPEVPILLLGTAAAAIHGVIFPMFGLLLSSAIKSFYEPPEEMKKDARFWALLYVGLGATTFVIVPLQHYFFALSGGKLVERVRSLSFARVVHQEISWFDEPSNSSGSVGARLAADASTVRGLVGDTLALIVQNSSTLTTAMVMAMLANWRLATVILMLIPLIGLQGYVQMKFLHGFSADAKIMYEEASQVANDAVSSIRTVASFCAEKKVLDSYLKKCEAPLKNGTRLGLVSGSGLGISNFMLNCVYAICFYVGAHFVRDGKSTFEQVLKVFFCLTMAAIGISQTSAVATDANKAKDSAASIFSIIDRKSRIDSSIDEGKTLDTVMGQIEFQHISFKYPTRPDVQIFKDLCLTVPSGKTVALVGESGSGKSTVIGLLERFYDPDSGTVLLDGVRLENLKISWLRQQMGLVGQEPAMFNDTIRANIAYGKAGKVTEEEIIAVAEAANAHRFISSLPQGYDTNVGERGVQLSGGQKQRIAIARAIIKDPRILLLDEATSALDTESERVVQEALERVMVGRTSVVVAHRLSTISGADIIAVVKNGVIAEQGRHQSLLKIEGGLYASLVALHKATP